LLSPFLAGASRLLDASRLTAKDQRPKTNVRRSVSLVRSRFPERTTPKQPAFHVPRHADDCDKVRLNTTQIRIESWARMNLLEIDTGTCTGNTRVLSSSLYVPVDYITLSS
jgi:hypothetical protein